MEVSIMNCPKCRRDMMSGFLQTGNLIAFNKTRHRVSLNPKQEEDVMIANKVFTGSDFHAFICKECGRVLFDYKNIITRL